jgi:exopolyphosphatase / guanosine-5'-triphosphate,3'-diphosphate pyrophosphatase
MSLAATREADRCAVVDIGSNSVRLVIFAADRRVPSPLLNEKVGAHLGKTLQDDGRMPARGMEVALRGLARFRLLAEGLGVSSTLVVATAAVRDASNGPEFLDRVRAIGFDPQLLSGSEEAAASALGVMCAFPGAKGVVADLGGGSLELVAIGNGIVADGLTLPLGTLRLAKLREKWGEAAPRKLRGLIADGAPHGMAKGGTLFLVGGSWRALAQFAMHQIDWPVRTPHGFTLAAGDVPQLVETLALTPEKALQKVPRLPAARVASLNDGAAVLAALVAHLEPELVVTSALGLREGLMFRQLAPSVRALDPLTADLADQLGPAAAGTIYGPPLFAWATAAFPGEAPGSARLRLAASWLGHPLRQAEKPTRRERALELALHEPLVGVDAEGRGILAAALLAFAGERDLPPAVVRLAGAPRLEQAARWGSLMRLAEKVSAGSEQLLAMCRIESRDGALILDLMQHRALYGEGVESQHKATAEQLGLVPRVVEQALAARRLR